MSELNPQAFRTAMERFRETPVMELRDRPQILLNLIEAWGNSRWSAWSEYLLACLEATASCKGPILECGSGLTTILIGAVAKQHDVQLWALENHAEWHERVGQVLEQYELTNTTILHAPLKDYGEYSWYTPPLKALPEDFALVICDGPPGATTPGGRFGLLPVMGDRLGTGCIILLDDGGRAEEQEIARKWAATIGSEVESFGTEKPYLRLQVGHL